MPPSPPPPGREGDLRTLSLGFGVGLGLLLRLWPSSGLPSRGEALLLPALRGEGLSFLRLLV